MTAKAMSDSTASDGVTRRPLPGRLGYALCAAVAGIVLVLDQATKFVALQTLPPPQPTAQVVDSSLPLLQWQLIGNTGGAFSIPGFTWMFVAVTVIVLVLVTRALPRTDRLGLTVAYGLVAGGALGNVSDRLLRSDGLLPEGAVVDFIKLGAWPTFNVADMAIVCGAALILLLTLAAEREARRHARAGPDHQSVRPPTATAQRSADTASQPEANPPDGPPSAGGRASADDAR